MSRVMVTGGAGFIGSNLVDRLLSDGHEVIVLDNLSTGKRENLNQAAKFVECDISDFAAIKDHFEGVEVVFHCAALARITPSVKDPLPVHAANATGTLNVLWASHKAGVKKVIYSGSSSAYGDHDKSEYPLSETAETHPKSPYAASKLMGEQYCQLFSELYNLPTVILRYFNVYGLRQLTEGAYATVVGIFLAQRQKGEPMTVVADAWERRRDHTYITDVVEANILSWQKEVPPGEIINIGFGKNFTTREITELIGGPTTEIEPRPWEYDITLADTSKAKDLLGWQPKVRFPEGIAKLKEDYGLK